MSDASDASRAPEGPLSGVIVRPPRPLACLDDIVEAARSAAGRQAVAVAPSQENFVLSAARLAMERDLADPVLVGDAAATRAKAAEVGLDLSRCRMIDVPDPAAAVAEGVRLFRAGEVALLTKGIVATSVLLRAVLDKETGVPPRGILSHVAVFEHPRERRLVLLTDPAVNISPNLQRKVEIVRNAVRAARCLGIERPRVAMLAATEKVNFPAMPATLDGQLIAQMADAGEFGDCLVGGPLAMDMAMSETAARLKGVDHPAAGHADILVAPDIEAANILYKTLSTLVGLTLASAVVGSELPVVLPSRADSEMTKFYSIALAILLSRGGPCPVD